MSSSPGGGPTVLFVDDDEAFLRSVKRAIVRHGYTVITATSGEAGLTELQRADPAVEIVVSDDQMPGMAGPEFLSLVRDRHPDTVRIMLTGQPSVASAIKAINSGEVFRFLEKPCSTDMLVLTMELAMQVRRLQQASVELLQRYRGDRRARMEAAEQAQELEREVRGITEVRRDSAGAIVLDDAGMDLDSLTAAIRKELSS